MEREIFVRLPGIIGNTVVRALKEVEKEVGYKQVIKLPEPKSRYRLYWIAIWIAYPLVVALAMGLLIYFGN